MLAGLFYVLAHTRQKKHKKKPIVGDGQRLHTAIRCFTQGISMLINQGVDL